MAYWWCMRRFGDFKSCARSGVSENLVAKGLRPARAQAVMKKIALLRCFCCDPLVGSLLDRKLQVLFSARCLGVELRASPVDSGEGCKEVFLAQSPEASVCTASCRQSAHLVCSVGLSKNANTLPCTWQYGCGYGCGLVIGYGCAWGGGGGGLVGRLGGWAVGGVVGGGGGAWPTAESHQQFR